MPEKKVFEARLKRSGYENNGCLWLVAAFLASLPAIALHNAAVMWAVPVVLLATAALAYRGVRSYLRRSTPVSVRASAEGLFIDGEPFSTVET